MFGHFPHELQTDSFDCGLACIRMILRYYGCRFTERELAAHSFVSRNGISMRDLSDTATYFGFKTQGARLSVDALQSHLSFPCILHWNQNHYVVCYKIRGRAGHRRFYIADPASRNLVYKEDEFLKCWGCDNDSVHMGVALFLIPTEKLDAFKGRKEKAGRVGLRFLLSYFTRYRKGVMIVFITMLVISVLQLVAPLLMQISIDYGVNAHNLHVIQLLLLSQMVIFVSSLVVSMVRSWATLYMNTKISISLISDFLFKLLQMPFRFFDTRHTGDLLQRIRDNDRIQNFLTGSSMETLFSMVNFVVFAVILCFYDPRILLLFFGGNVCYVAWTQYFMRYRTSLDLKRFNSVADEQELLLQIVKGIGDIKLFNCEKQKRWQWERIQAEQFSIRVKNLTVAQVQQLGSVFFNQSTNILISYLACVEVVKGDLSLGMMMSISYIIGQISAPINNLIDFLTSFQFARLSMERLHEIQMQQDETDGKGGEKVTPQSMTIKMQNVDFSYSGAARNYVLQDFTLVIPAHKVTALVGASGVGKTTLLKLILGFYEPVHGKILVDGIDLHDIDCHQWRRMVGCVMQDGYIFSDDFLHNIALGEDRPDEEQVRKAARMANIDEYISSLPMGYLTRIGEDGQGLSQGQKQRLMIARAVYKDPQLLILDEATNSLDANNERDIVAHLETFYRQRTVIIVAHRLSTIRNADQIVVLNEGRVVEQGDHDSLMQAHSYYYRLVQNQLETIK